MDRLPDCNSRDRVTMIDTLFGDAGHHLADLARLGGLIAAV
jgi:hypothetical protein